MNQLAIEPNEETATDADKERRDTYPSDWPAWQVAICKTAATWLDRQTAAGASVSEQAEAIPDLLVEVQGLRIWPSVATKLANDRLEALLDDVAPDRHEMPPVPPLDDLDARREVVLDLLRLSQLAEQTAKAVIDGLAWLPIQSR